ncbi:ATP-binding cassette domain-containing protein [Ilumatobacter sp.]|uniref:ATP-binding cassette domain-containing protein n=1 Tax=Ilumatobacter sp. TaxID=1967498 RepID=UPI003C6B8432
MSPVLEVRGLEKHFVLHNIDGRMVAGLRGVDLDVSAGEHVVLAGSSGAGKTSLLKCVHRTYLPSAGTLALRLGDGTTVDLASIGEREVVALRGRELGYVSQFLQAPPRRGPFDIVVRAATDRGMDRDAAHDAAAVALRRLNIDEAMWDVYATVLSGGERQRVNLAAGTVSPPRLLLLDEPVSALDPANRSAALELIDELAGHGVAVLSVFHDLEAIERLATRVVLMRHGEVVDAGPPERILPELTGVAR